MLSIIFNILKKVIPLGGLLRFFGTFIAGGLAGASREREKANEKTIKAARKSTRRRASIDALSDDDVNARLRKSARKWSRSVRKP